MLKDAKLIASFVWLEPKFYLAPIIYFYAMQKAAVFCLAWAKFPCCCGYLFPCNAEGTVIWQSARCQANCGGTHSQMLRSAIKDWLA